MRKGDVVRVLITDDDKQLVKLLAIKLGRLGYKVGMATTAQKGYELALNDEYDLIILDILMPQRSGLEVCRDLRMHGILTPVLILSGKTDKTSIVECLEAGADDYLTKPFSHSELVARIRALVRRNKKSFAARFVTQYEIVLDTATHAIKLNKQSMQLTEKETQLLQRLMYSSPEPVPRKVLLEDVWGIDDKHTSNRLEVYIRRLREKLEKLSGSSHIHNVRGRGYYFGKS